MLKIIVIGERNSGKTQFINRFVQNRFADTHKATIACEFAIKILNIDDNEIRLQMWDMVGDDRMFRGTSKLFCKGAAGALVLADITDRESIEATAKWKKLVGDEIARSSNRQMLSPDEDEQIPMALVLNKYDLVEENLIQGENYHPEEYMTTDFLQNFAEENGFIGATCTSAKTGVGVTEAIASLIR